MKTSGNNSQSVRLTSESSDYFIDKERRERLHAQSAHERTLRLLPRPARRRSPHRWLKIALFVFPLALLLTPLSVMRAQDGPQSNMESGEDGYHPAMVEYRMGLFHLVRGEWELAITRFDQAIHLLPDYAAAFEARGYVYQTLGNAERAIADYQQAIGAVPEYGPTYKVLADLY